MYLFGLNPKLVTFVQIGNHGNLNNMIAAAKQVETGFNITIGKVNKTAAKKNKEKDTEVNVLTA
jgi:hypothetical protein